jgi:hypothetical protein
MSPCEKTMPENIAQHEAFIQTLIEKIESQRPPQAQAGALAGWKAQAQAQPSEPESISVPISIQTQAGKVRLYLNFRGVPFTPESLRALLESLIGEGIPVDVWQDKGAWGGNKWKR